VLQYQHTCSSSQNGFQRKIDRDVPLPGSLVGGGCDDVASCLEELKVHCLQMVRDKDRDRVKARCRWPADVVSTPPPHTTHMSADRV
jgi:hypothetical protein